MSRTSEREARKLLRLAVAHFGPKTQLVKCVEEMSELQKEICKLLADREKYSRESLIEELEDVEIMLEQLRMIASISPEEERRMQRRKLMLLEERLLFTREDGPQA